MKNLIFSILLSCVFTLNPQLSFCKTSKLKYTWDKIPNQEWLGYNFWCNSFTDWKVKDGKVVASPYFSYKRTAHITSHKIDSNAQKLKITIDLKFGGGLTDKETYLGVLIGAGSNELSDKTNNFIFNTNSPRHCHLFGVKNNGVVFIQNYHTGEIIDQFKLSEEVIAELDIKNYSFYIEYNKTTITYGINDKRNNLVKLKNINNQAIPHGNLALTYNSEQAFKTIGFFDNFIIKSRSLIEKEAQSVIDPILGSFYTNTKDSLFITAQLMPLNKKQSDHIKLVLKKGWFNQKHKGKYDTLSRQIRFRIATPKDYEKIKYSIKYKGNQTRIKNWREGIVYKKPKTTPTIMALNCNGFPFYARDKVDYNNLLYPYTQIEKGYNLTNPDLLVFLGDQIYESRPNMPIHKLPSAPIDYLYKWSIWCYTFRNLTLNQPTIILTDDHDVYQGNLWGDGGKIAKVPHKDSIPEYYGNNIDTWQQDNGGYFMPKYFVNLAISSQTSHLPHPYLPFTNTGIKNYFTTYKYGDLNICVLEDKKYKSPPSMIDTTIFNGYPTNINLPQESFSSTKTLHLLGPQQLNMLKTWTSSRRAPKEKRLILTQSAFASLTTVQKNYTPLNDQPARKDSVEQKVSPDMDTNGWPKIGRDRALNIINNDQVLFLSGDQHMGAVIEVYDSANNAIPFFSVPAIANTWPRMWWPSTNTATANYPLGIYIDAFGNKINVKAVANPNPDAPHPNSINYKSPGFGVVQFNEKGTEAIIKAYPLYFDIIQNKQYKFWPVKQKL